MGKFDTPESFDFFSVCRISQAPGDGKLKCNQLKDHCHTNLRHQGILTNKHPDGKGERNFRFFRFSMFVSYCLFDRYS
jgi:hypothetical protein